MGPDERFFIEYIGRQSTSEADDGRRGPHEGCAENQSWDVTPEHAVNYQRYSSFQHTTLRSTVRA